MDRISFWTNVEHRRERFIFLLSRAFPTPKVGVVLAVQS